MYEDFGMVLFNTKGNILGINRIAAEKFYLRKESVVKGDTANSLVIFDVFEGLQDCLRDLSKINSKDVFYHLDYNVEAVKKYIQLVKISDTDNNDEENNKNDLKNSQKPIENESNMHNQIAKLKVIAHINLMDEDTQDVFVMYFNVPDEPEVSDHKEYWEQKNIDVNSKSFTDRISRISENSFLLNNETAVTSNDLDTNSNKKNLSVNSQNTLQKVKKNGLDMKKGLFNYSTSKKQIIFDILAMLLMIVVFLLFLTSGLMTIRNLKKNDEFNELNYKYAKTSKSLWKAAFYTRKIDFTYNSDNFDFNDYKRYKDELKNAKTMLQNNLTDLIAFYHSNIVDKHNYLEKVYIDYILSSTKLNERVYPANAFLQYITYCENIYNDQYRSFNTPNAYSALYYILKNGMKGLYVG